MSSSLAAIDPNAWITLSRDFLAFVAAEGEGSLDDLAKKVSVLVALAEATELPVLSDAENELDERPPPAGDWLDHAERRFPALTDYRQEEEADLGYAPDNVCEIAEEFDRWLQLLALGHERPALWEWRFAYEHHWGPHHAAPLLTQLALRGATPTSR
ncbi:DUF5063 domain-containing protein [Caulobacter sp. BE254]|uniref:DUF5063 domain-containing protein n=1 Tax=Caulobacter sp. BE254 TaxID=2817720 RepID=UPI002866DD8E|nr:DUF5063 domain-containing protein [Caulobacter sp. BE254]MDR7118836.1 hypothetical protein [Caulobacter sp. BE254]